MTSPRLTVVLPNYNHGRFLGRAIGTIMSQTRPPDEFLILDDGSTDDSLDRIHAAAARYPLIRVLQNPRNTGLFAAHQRLFEEAHGEYLYPASADDELLPYFFEQAMGLAAQHPAAGLVCGQMVIAEESGREVDLVSIRSWTSPLFASPERYLREYLEVEEPSHALTSSTIFRRECLAEVGWFRPELGSWSDTFAVRAIGLKHGACYLPTRCAIWRRMEENYSAESRRDDRHLLAMISRAAAAMRLPEFADRFPEAYVQQWERRYRWRVVKDYLRGGLSWRDQGWRGPWRLATQVCRRLPGALSLWSYRDGAS